MARIQPCPWKEFRTGDGKRYWSNIHTGISVWEEPQELKTYRAQLARLQQQTAAAPPAATFAAHAIGDSPFIPTISTVSTVSTVSTNASESADAATGSAAGTATSTEESAPLGDSGASPAGASSPGEKESSKEPSAGKATWTTPEEAKAAFESLLREVVTHPSMSWKEAVPLLTGDIRYTVGVPAGREG